MSKLKFISKMVYRKTLCVTAAESVSRTWEDIFNFVKRPEYQSNHNVLLVGLPGVGKSSLINTVIKVLTKTWIQKAVVGAGAAASKTKALTWFDCMGVTTDDLVFHPDDRLRHFVYTKSFPNLIDFAGLKDQSDDRLVELLELIINGQIPPNTTIQDLHDKQEKYCPGDLQDTLPSANKRKIDTVIFVHSVMVAVPKDLISSLLKALEKKGGNQGIRIFVVLTKCDMVKDDEKLKTEKEKVKEKLALEFSIIGAEDDYLFEWTNYRDEDQQEDPTTEKNVLKLLKKVVAPRPSNESEGFKDSPMSTQLKLAVKNAFRSLNIRLRDFVLAVLLFIAIAIITFNSLNRAVVTNEE